jgi:hypothetical protein
MDWLILNTEGFPLTTKDNRLELPVVILLGVAVKELMVGGVILTVTWAVTDPLLLVAVIV